MDNEQQNQYRMGTQLTVFLQDHDLSASDAATAEAADVRKAYAAVGVSLGQGTTNTRENTATAEALQQQVLHVLPALLGPLRSVARKLVPDANERAALLARATISARQLNKLRPAALAEVAKHLLEDAATYQTQLAKYGYTPAVNALVKGHLDAFAATVGTTRTVLQTNQGTHASTTDLLKEFMTQTYELDDAMQVFRVLNADLHRDYLIARKVGKSGGGKKKGKEGAGDGAA